VPSPPDGAGSDPVRTTTVVYQPKGGSGYSRTNAINLRRVDVGPPAWEALVAQFALRYPSASTRR